MQLVCINSSSSAMLLNLSKPYIPSLCIEDISPASRGAIKCDGRVLVIQHSAWHIVGALCMIVGH